MMHLGRKIKELASKKNLKPEDLAYKIGRSSKMIYEDFKKDHLNTELLMKYAEALGVTIVSFFDEDAVSYSKNVVSEDTEVYKKYEYTLEIQRKYIEKLEKENEVLSKYNQNQAK